MLEIVRHRTITFVKKLIVGSFNTCLPYSRIFRHRISQTGAKGRFNLRISRVSTYITEKDIIAGASVVICRHYLHGGILILRHRRSGVVASVTSAECDLQ